MQLPHCEQFSQPPNVPMTIFAPRLPASIASSPIHSSQTRVQRLQRMQRCGSFATIGERYLSAFAFFFSMKRSDRKSTRLNSSHLVISYAVFCLKKKKNKK